MAANRVLIAVMYATIATLAVVVGLFTVFDPLAPYTGSNSVRVPILMYHHFADDGLVGTTISAEAFEGHLKALSDAGYTAVTFEELVDYVDNGAPLPERPVVITIDDGYESVYEVAYPLLKQYGMHATVFIVGVLHGQEFYKDSGLPIQPRVLTDEQAFEMLESGLVSFQSHSFDMHQHGPFVTNPDRRSVMRSSGESAREHVTAFVDDFNLSAAQIRFLTGERPFVYSYPFGLSSNLTDRILRDSGIRVSLKMERGINIVVEGSQESLFSMRRFNVPGDMSPEALIVMIGG